MSRPHRRLPANVRFEALEGRALLSGAGTPDPTFGGGTGYGSVSLGVPSLTPFVLGANNISYSAGVSSVVTLSNGNVAMTGVIDVLGNTAAQDSAELAITEVGPFGGAVESFGDRGLVLLPAELQGHFVAAAEPNGDIFVAGDVGGNTGFAAVELDAHGAPVSTFGVNGLAQYPAGSTTPAANRLGSVVAALLQPGGKIVLVGSSAGSAGTSDFAAVRLNPDGSIDTSYGQGGTVDLPVAVNTVTQDLAAGAVMQANGQIVVAGVAASGQYSTGNLILPAQELAVLRINADGSLDATYGGATAAGVVLFPPDPANPTAQTATQAMGIALDPTSGDVLVSANVRGGGSIAPYNGPVLYRLGSDGKPDKNFLRSGSRLTPGVAGPVVVQSNGDILVAGNIINQGLFLGAGEYQAVGVIRLNAVGSPDETFGNTGTSGLFIAHSPDLTLVGGLAIEPGTGAIILGGVGTGPVLAGGGTKPSPGARDEDFTAVQLLPIAFPAVPPARPLATAPADFTGASYADVALYNPTNSTFNYKSPTGQEASVSFGISGLDQTIPAAADYLGIGSDQVAAYLPSLGVYAIQPLAGYTTTGGGGSAGLALKFGIPGSGQTIPTPADFDGDGKADVAVYLPEYATFAILPSDGSAPLSVPFGAAGQGNSIPVPADYFGFGRADLAVYLTQVGAYAIRNPVSGQDTIVPFGKAGYGESIPVPGVYDGLGKVELAVYEPSLGAFFYAPSDGGPVVEVAMGEANSGDIPVPGDYDGAGYDEFAIYNPAGGYIEYRPSNGGPDVIEFTASANTGSIPLAEPPANLPEFNNPPPPPPPIPSAAKAQAVAVAPATASTSTPATAPVVRASAVPAGPSDGTARIARALVNQAAPDPTR